MMASFRPMRRQLSARLRWLNCGQVGERGSCPLTEVTHILRPAEIEARVYDPQRLHKSERVQSKSSRPDRFVNAAAHRAAVRIIRGKKPTAVVTTGAQSTVLKTCD